MEDLTGNQFGSYRLVALLGEGGLAAVYKAYQANIGRDVALKAWPRGLAGDPHFMARFQHPHILPIISAL